MFWLVRRLLSLPLQLISRYLFVVCWLVCLERILSLQFFTFDVQIDKDAGVNLIIVELQILAYSIYCRL